MYVAPDAFIPPLSSISLKPFDKKSNSLSPGDKSSSAFVALGCNLFVTGLNGDLLSSYNCHSCVALVRFNITHAGRKPVYTNGPLVLPLPT